MDILEQIEILEKKYKKLNKKFSKLKILKTKNSVYIEKDKTELLLLWEKYIIFFKKLRKFINKYKYRKFFVFIDYEKMIIRRYLLIFYFNCLVDLINNFWKNEEFIRIFLSENYKYDFWKIAKYIYKPRFINLLNTPAIFLKVFKWKINKKYYFMLEKEKNDIGKNRRILTDYRNLYYYFKRRFYKILFFLSKNIWKIISSIKFSTRKKWLITKENIKKYLEIAEPWDILLTRWNWNASNITIPGFWKHMSLYLWNWKFLKKHFWDKKYDFLKVVKDDYHYIIEATGKWVEIKRIEKLLLHNDYLWVSRTKFSKEKILNSIKKAISFYGLAYDFIFNFYSNNNVVCSELVLKSYAKRDKDDDWITVKLEKIKWSLTYPPQSFISKIKQDKNLEFVFFLDSIEKTWENFISNENEFFKTQKRPRFSFLLK